jgi:predicted GIY-YIG superfamily endonuclease
MFPKIEHENLSTCIAYANENIPDCPGFYIIHFLDVCPESNSPLGHAEHYSGSTDNLRKRYIRHCRGRGANLLRVNNLRNGKYIPKMAFLPFPTGEDSRNYEHYSKKQLKNPKKYCPLCGQSKLPYNPQVIDKVKRAEKIFSI